jgi:lysophospholipase L1-like esterase
MRAIILLVVLVTGLACGKKSSVAGALPPPPIPIPAAGATKSFLALGDSYTIGQSVEVTERFPAQSVAILRAQGMSISDPVYIAQTGWTTENLQAAITMRNPASNYDIVTLLIGVNDQYQRMDTGGYARRFARLLEKAVQLAGGRKERVFVLSIPDYSATPFVPASDKERVRKEIDWFNAINKRITLDYGVSYTDITPTSRDAENNVALVARDNLHPSGLEYKKWAELLAPKIKDVLQ